jgi:hypothetical protein
VNSTGLHGGGSGDGQEPPQPAADDSEWHKAGDGTRHLECEQKRRRWTPYLAAMLRVRSPSQQGKESIYSKSPSPPPLPSHPSGPAAQLASPHRPSLPPLPFPALARFLSSSPRKRRRPIFPLASLLSLQVGPACQVHLLPPPAASSTPSSWPLRRTEAPRRLCRMDLPGPTTSVGTRTDYSVGPWDYPACTTWHLKAWSTRTTQE